MHCVRRPSGRRPCASASRSHSPFALARSRTSPARSRCYSCPVLPARMRNLALVGASATTLDRNAPAVFVERDLGGRGHRHFQTHLRARLSRSHLFAQSSLRLSFLARQRPLGLVPIGNGGNFHRNPVGPMGRESALANAWLALRRCPVRICRGRKSPLALGCDCRSRLGSVDWLVNGAAVTSPESPASRLIAQRYSSLPAARSLTSVKSASRKSYFGRSVGAAH